MLVAAALHCQPVVQVVPVPQGHVAVAVLLYEGHQGVVAAHPPLIHEHGRRLVRLVPVRPRKPARPPKALILVDQRLQQCDPGNSMQSILLVQFLHLQLSQMIDPDCTKDRRKSQNITKIHERSSSL